MVIYVFFFFNEASPTYVYTDLHTLSRPDSLPILVLAGLDEITFGIDEEKTRLGALDLPADNQRRAEQRLGRRPLVAVAHYDIAERFADDPRDREHRRRFQNRRMSPLGRLGAFGTQPDENGQGARSERVGTS